LNLDLVTSRHMNLPRRARLAGAQVLGLVQFTPGTVTTWDTTNASAGTKRATDEWAGFADQTLDLLAVLVCHLAEALAQTTGQLSHTQRYNMTGTSSI